MAQKKKAKRGSGATNKRRRERAKAAAEAMGKARQAHDQLRMHLKKAHGHMRMLAADPFVDG
jgi:hypothetical protein